MAALLERERHLSSPEKPSRNVLLPYAPQEAWYARGEEIHGIHGMGHAARVLVFQEALAEKLQQQGVLLDRAALRLAAAIHDTRRISDDADEEHGERAAVWLEATMREQIAPQTLATVQYIVTWHVPEDSTAPDMTSELRIFKDADALDRVRGTNDFDPSFLRIPYSHQLILPAQRLYTASMQQSSTGIDTFTSILDHAVRQGLLRP